MNNENLNARYPIIPENIKLRDYQKAAIKSWFSNNGQGLYEMATGTGKTLTALSTAAKLGEHLPSLAIIIVCPYTHLVDQWVKDIKKYNMDPIIAYKSKDLWVKRLSEEITAFNTGLINHYCCITTNATFSTDAMQSVIKRMSGNTLIIADEAHHLGSRQTIEILPENIKFRLALSATPNRWYDDSGTQRLLQYFGGKVVFEYGLEKAIGTHLTNYYYLPHLVYLDSDEAEQYFEITNKLVKYMFGDEGLDMGDSAVSNLLIKRARILSMARNKVHKLASLMKDRTNSLYNIVYCGDSKVDGKKQLDVVVDLLRNQFKMNVHTFTSREDKNLRAILLDEFESGKLQALVAIKCLDEGVDVPATQTAYILASSTNPREFIQRRGRVLRKHPLKEFSYIHDFIVLPRRLEELSLIEPHVFNIERNLLKREMARFTEFAQLAMNGPEAHEMLNEIKHAYNLLDI
ncbi:DEAD/DEAH box helicase family protein [Bacillus infantis]|uniref:DEAD/DEAH box helicase family protein n=1 Tax=Bacillus infantis TaxID=324767 RepID=UPI002005B0E7|nr:DEAD/DEAH box helicase family protein [Bacillus infantis]MCK6207709.1 DEAD/DEAH box helicase family protein [Bacillus infantis]